MNIKKGELRETNEKGYWTKHRKWSTEDEVYEFLYGLTRAIKPKNCLEVGTFIGDGAVAIAQALKENEAGKIWTIDITAFEDVEEKLKQYDNIVMVRGRAPEVFATLPFKELDLIFLDSGHDYGQVITELRAVEKYLTKGGFIVIHDILHVHWGQFVQRAVNEFMSEHPDYSTVTLTNFNGLAIIQRKL